MWPFFRPEGIALDGSGNILVGDTNNHTIRRISAAGVVTTFAGMAGEITSDTDGTGSDARINYPWGVVVNSNGNLYVSQALGGGIRRITAAAVVTTITRYGFLTGGITVDGGGNVYVAATGLNTIDKFTLSLIPPAIVAQPVSISVTAGQSATFSVTATGSPAPTFQWRKGGTALGGATSATFSLANVQAADAGSYTVTVANSAGNVVSNAAVLTMIVPPTITNQPASATVALGQAATFTVNATGSPAPSYQWNKDGVAIGGATNSTLTLSNVQSTNAGTYTVVVSNGAGSVTSNAAVLTIPPAAPTITAQPQDHNALIGANVTLRVSVSGLALSAVTDADAGNYAVVVTNGAERVPSRVATLVVSPARSKIINMSVRTSAGAGNETLIVGFAVAGAAGGAKPLLVRAIGPSLTVFGVTGVLADPELALYRDSIQIFNNNNWGDSLAFDQIVAAARTTGAFDIGTRSLDAALAVALQPGSYTAQVVARGNNGVALLELYDADVAAPSQLVNVSARSSVAPGAGVLIVGFFIEGNVPKRMLLRGIGPTLGALGLTGTLTDPQLALYRGNEVVATNDDWWRGGGAQVLAELFRAAGAFTLASGTRDAALEVTLAPGAYTAQVSSADGGTGVALVEVYEVP
ncbi:MAG: immunoglobulin domain-containing protein [Verrucomicrobia bacterium]|nr:immunoglobulin domain-containing protein [Verrucomicrobiota bacterium]